MDWNDLTNLMADSAFVKKSTKKAETQTKTHSRCTFGVALVKKGATSLVIFKGTLIST